MKTQWIGLAGVLILTACAVPAVQGDSDPIPDAAPTDTPQPAIETEPVPDLPNLGPAPELQNEVWLNVEEPLRLVDLRGQVVLLDMWTFG